MAGNNNKKFFFREPGLDPNKDKVENLPREVAEWLDPTTMASKGSGGPGGTVAYVDLDALGVGGGGFPSTNQPAPSDVNVYIPDVPGLKAKQPQILSVVDQQVVQDPQGTATVTATFSIGPEQDSMEYELRLTK